MPNELTFMDVVRITVGGTAVSTLIAKPVADLNMSEQAQAYAALCHLEKLIAARKDALKPTLLAVGEAEGETFGEKGSKRLALDGAEVTVERRVASEPDHDKMLAYTKESGLEIEAVFDAITHFQFNPSKAQFLIETGKLDQAKIDAMKKVTPALSVTPTEHTKELLETVAPIPKKGKK